MDESTSAWWESRLRRSDPFAVLGPHLLEPGRWVIRACVPGAERVSVLLEDCSTQTRLAAAPVAEGCFAVVFSSESRPRYKLELVWDRDHTEVVSDPYSISRFIDSVALHGFSSGMCSGETSLCGASERSVDGSSGYGFAVWAPNANSVSVIGDFNGWNAERHPMRLLHEHGVWELFIPGVAAGARYKFSLEDRNGVTREKADPYALSSEIPPRTASVTVRDSSHRCLPKPRIDANQRSRPMSIYEVHAGSWRHPVQGDVDWDWLGASLVPYVAALGFTHIELLPISAHPFAGSWGYQPTGLYACDPRLGDPSAFERFVVRCHETGLGVILDWVPAHFPADEHGLAMFDGTALYEYQDKREGYHQDWGTLIYNFGRNEVRSFLIGSALHWLDRFGLDGLRVDAVASMLYRDYSRAPGEWVPNAHGGRENLEAIDFLRRLNTLVGARAGTLSIAEESTAFPGVSAPVHSGGLGFHYKWNMGWMNDTLRYMQLDPVHRRWHHDLMTFGLVYAFSENYILPISHDEVVHGKGSLFAKMPGDQWQKLANVRAYLAFMWAHPGKKLLFMGQEFAQPSEWNHDSPLPWEVACEPAHAGITTLVAGLNRMYRECAAMHALDCDPRGFCWLVERDSENSVYAWTRTDGAGDYVLAVFNFTPIPRHGYRLPVPGLPTRWLEVLNTDALEYGGSGVGNLGAELVSQAGEDGALLELSLPPLAAIYLRAL